MKDSLAYVAEDRMKGSGGESGKGGEASICVR